MSTFKNLKIGRRLDGSVLAVQTFCCHLPFLCPSFPYGLCKRSNVRIPPPPIDTLPFPTADKDLDSTQLIPHTFSFVTYPLPCSVYSELPSGNRPLVSTPLASVSFPRKMGPSSGSMSRRVLASSSPRVEVKKSSSTSRRSMRKVSALLRWVNVVFFFGFFMIKSCILLLFSLRLLTAYDITLQSTFVGILGGRPSVFDFSPSMFTDVKHKNLSSAFYLLYLFFGVYLVSFIPTGWWTRRVHYHDGWWWSYPCRTCHWTHGRIRPRSSPSAIFRWGRSRRRRIWRWLRWWPLLRGRGGGSFVR